MQMKHLPRLLPFVLLTVALMLTLALMNYDQFFLVVYKITLVSLAAVAGYWLDRALFPYARPDAFLAEDWRITAVSKYGRKGAVDYPIVDDHHAVFFFSMLRRAIIVAAAILGVTLGL